MKKLISILTLIVCIGTISLSLLLNTSKNTEAISILDYLYTNAQAKEEPVDGYYYAIGNCIVCTPGKGACFVSIQCCWNQTPYSPFEF